MIDITSISGANLLKFWETEKSISWWEKLNDLYFLYQKIDFCDTIIFPPEICCLSMYLRNYKIHSIVNLSSLWQFIQSTMVSRLHSNLRLTIKGNNLLDPEEAHQDLRKLCRRTVSASNECELVYQKHYQIIKWIWRQRTF